MDWSKFWDAVGSFFSNIGSVFLANIKAAIPVVEQAALNLLETIADAVIAGIENGTIPLPALATEAVVKSQESNHKRDTAFSAIQAKLAVPGTVPLGTTINDSTVYLAIEIAVQKYKVNNSGNGGNFPGGNSGSLGA